MDTKDIIILEQLEGLAISTLYKHSTLCDDMLELILPMLDLDEEIKEDMFIIHQVSDGHVLVWGDKNLNTPISKIIKLLQTNNRLITIEDLI